MGISNIKTRCVLVLGGSFDPVHIGHIALASSLTQLLKPDELRIIPAGQPWQKNALTATSEQRVSMLKLAFENWTDCPLYIDEQEIRRAERQQSSYTIDTLRQLRAELGAETSLNFAMGADQLLNLHTWHQWRDLFEVANLCAAARPGYSLKIASQDVAKEWQDRLMNGKELRSRSHGGTALEPELAIDVSATRLRTELKQHNPTMRLLVPHKVLDYIQQHSIY
ncbi:nicotinate (nicotinamide) nucleotide adenylyltransferase [Undibacterium jejuense]|uniref:Probable nicotinate-nucleotide adenylyltransferase n=1 Tax=Undibacterium jejuense TaxID=1344949 RepID=A0A923HFS3_9BURK|nr:nicotinate (nicotinamide) nucleotide adenylyltransferase [Undibacterium jejuense]MBC3863737.1 nicotinate (nicotinamide) nucleotide adenylyltransferase [Undibacterium jejuense]